MLLLLYRKLLIKWLKLLGMQNGMQPVRMLEIKPKHPPEGLKGRSLRGGIGHLLNLYSNYSIHSSQCTCRNSNYYTHRNTIRKVAGQQGW